MKKQEKEKNQIKEYEECALCHCQTGILKIEEIETRKYYIEGCGQLCKNCYLEIQKEG